MTPERAVAIDGEPALVWFERDPNTGSVISVNSEGRHTAAVEYSGILNYGPMNKLTLYYIFCVIKLVHYIISFMFILSINLQIGNLFRRASIFASIFNAQL